MSARIAVIGTGYVGLTTGVCLAHLGHTVVCADVDAAKVARLSAGEMPIVEDGLADLLASGLASGRLTFVVGASTAAAQCEIAFLCVPTPQGDDGSADLSYIEAASAETIKYAANAFLATKLSFVNAIAAICEGVGANVDDVIKGIGSDTRIGSSFLQPGPGWGGSCFPKDSRALVKIAEDAGYEFDLLSGVITVNDQQLDRMAHKVASAVGGSLAGRTVAAWGLTFKAGTDDLRESPAVAVITRLLQAGAHVVAHDPTVSTRRYGVPGEVELAASPLAACNGADVLCVLTEWPEYRAVPAVDVAAALTAPRVVDTRNLLDRAAWVAAGFTYDGVGR